MLRVVADANVLISAALARSPQAPSVRFITDLAAQTTLLTDPPGPHPAVCRDPRDDYLVALAVASGAEAIVTGDLDLLASDPDEVAIEVVTPRQLVDRLS